MKITGKIHLVRSDFTIQLNPQMKIERFVNSVIVFGDKILLIDTGTKGNADHIFSYIQGNGRDISDLDTVILSHSHPDHIGSAAEIKRRTGCTILAHEGERDWIEDIEAQVKARPVPAFFDLVDESVTIDGFLEHGQMLAVDEDVSLSIIHSPGHSKGSINILFPEDRILFTADSIPVKNDIPTYDDFHDLMNSLQSIKTNRDYSVLLTSWTPPLIDRGEIESLLDDAERYLKALDEAVREIYTGKESEALEWCRNVVSRLELPPFYVNPIVDKAFRGHKQ
ncbi:MAG TPA: MBL fold metallo-hydrolase [Syntrophales bacterium]|nr:MBL fold metallo-hydrolase [Syntrophales bacterium]HPQ43985.1 MBL fold metallo-hydrolase [Syntrophales bacterium]